MSAFDPSHYLEAELRALVRQDDRIFQFLQDGSLDGLWYWDLEAPDHEWMSPRFWKLFGYDPDEKAHAPSEWQDMIDPDDRDAALARVERHLADPGVPYDQVVRYRHKDGSTVWVRCRGLAIRDDDGRPVRMLGAHTDVTALKQVEEELREKNAELEQVNRELREALDRIETLRGMIPICAWCSRIRSDDGFWSGVETFIANHSLAEFTHGICPECLEAAEERGNARDEVPGAPLSREGGG